jgi:hypothetical protein
MLSTQTRLRVEFLCARIERGQSVEFSDMVWLDKWSHSNRTVYDMVCKARRRAINGPTPEGSLDRMLDDLNLGSPDPSTHLTGDSNIDDIVDFFKAPGWTQRD